MNKLAFNIKKVCKEKGVKLKNIAEQIGVTPESLSRSINGNPTVSTLYEIANALGVHINCFSEEKINTYGVIFYKNKKYIINDVNDLKELTKIIF